MIWWEFRCGPLSFPGLSAKTTTYRRRCLYQHAASSSVGISKNVSPGPAGWFLVGTSVIVLQPQPTRIRLSPEAHWGWARCAYGWRVASRHYCNALKPKVGCERTLHLGNEQLVVKVGVDALSLKERWKRWRDAKEKTWNFSIYLSRVTHLNV